MKVAKLIGFIALFFSTLALTGCQNPDEIELYQVKLEKAQDQNRALEGQVISMSERWQNAEERVKKLEEALSRAKDDLKREQRISSSRGMAPTLVTQKIGQNKQRIECKLGGK